MITQNQSLGYCPTIFILQTENGESSSLELVISDLIKSKSSEEAIIEVIKKYGYILSIEDLIAEDENGFGLPEDVITEAKKRKQIFDWCRKKLIK